VLAKELAAIPSSMIITLGGLAPTLAAKAATTTIPIVFAPISDPVSTGLVASHNRPGGNLTGVAALTVELDPKRVELLSELTPSKGPLGVLFNPTRLDSQLQIDLIKSAGRTVGRELVLVPARTPGEIEDAVGAFARQSVVGVLIAADSFFSAQRKLIVSLMARQRWPAIYQWREFADAGGLASFGANLFDSYRQTGRLAARILKGDQPANLPVHQPTTFEFVLNLTTARTLGLTIPMAVLGRADIVIE
jgi:putative ABC transport system substrate-binding protein